MKFMPLKSSVPWEKMVENRHNELKKIIMDTKTLPTLPGVIIKLNALSEDSRSTIQEMAHIVTSDQVLSARILRLANSPSYGFNRVSTISNAMILLGVNVVKSLALSSTFLEIMENDSLGLWEHSLGVAAAANLIARKLSLPECEEISTAALLHDIGRVVIGLKCQDEHELIIRLVNEKRIFMCEAEREVLGTDHAEVGGWLAKSWFLPDKLCDPISYHHNVTLSVNHRIKTSVVQLADVLVKASGFGDSGDEYVPHIQQEAWDILRMNEPLLAEIVDELEDRLVDVKTFSKELRS